MCLGFDAAAASRQGRRCRGVRQRGAVDSPPASAAPARQGDLLRTRSAVHPLSVPGIRGRSPGDGGIGRGLRDAARGAWRSDGRQGCGDRSAAQSDRRVARRDAGQARQADRPGQGPDPDPPALSRPLPQRTQGQGRHRRQRTGTARKRARYHHAVQLSGLEPRRRPRLRARRRAGRKTRRARSAR